MVQENFSSSPVAPSNMAANPPSSSSKSVQLSAIRARQAALESTISELLSQRTSLVESLSSPSDAPESEDADIRAKIAVEDANQKIKAQIKQLQQYNDIKDIGTQLMGLIAEKRGCRIAEVQDEYAINPDD